MCLSRLSFALFVFLPKCLGALNVTLLTFLRTAAEQDNQRVPVFPEINPVARAEIEAILEYATAYPFDIREIADLHSGEGYCYTRRRNGIQPVEPLGVETPTLGVMVFPDIDHSLGVTHTIPFKQGPIRLLVRLDPRPGIQSERFSISTGSTASASGKPKTRE